MTSYRAAQCWACKHRHIAAPGLVEVLMPSELETCDAFPDGIPMIMTAEYGDHRRALEGDGGVRFELAPGDGLVSGDARDAFAMWERYAAAVRG